MAHNPHTIGPLSPDMAVLGCLYGAPGYGYDLHKTITQDLGQVWHLSQSQAYSILKRMQRQGMITLELVQQEKLPDKQLWHITDVGRSHFLSWLDATSGGSTRAIRMEFVTRLYFLCKYLPAKCQLAFARQRSEIEKQLERLRGNLQTLPASQTFNQMSLELRIEQLAATQLWLAQWAEKSCPPEVGH